MLCPKCGAWIGDDSVFCSKCGAEMKQPEAAAPVTPPVTPPVVQAPQQVEPYKVSPQVGGQIPEPRPVSQDKIPTYLTQNILLTIFSVICGLCYALPTAVTGLVFSAIADGALKQNEPDRARQNSKLARIFMWISFGLEIATAAFVIIAGIIGLVTGASVLGDLIRNGFHYDWNFRY